MASAFSHAIAAAALGQWFQTPRQRWKLLLLGMLCAVLPDLDVIGFRFGVSYGAPMGHRGFSHSILFACFFALLICALFYRENKVLSKGWWILFAYFFLCTLSHGLLDAITNGGHGVGFFIPFENDRYFFPWRPVLVSPIEIEDFFGEWGWKVMLSEWVYIWIPSVLFGLMGWLTRRIRRKS